MSAQTPDETVALLHKLHSSVVALNAAHERKSAHRERALAAQAQKVAEIIRQVDELRASIAGGSDGPGSTLDLGSYPVNVWK